MPLFISDKEILFFNQINNDLLKNVTSQKIYYFKIDNDLSTIHKLYGERLNIVYKTPIRLWARVDYTSPETTVSLGQITEDQNVLIHLNKKDAEEKLGITNHRDHIGHYIAFEDKFYEILNGVSPQLVSGQKYWEFSTILTCKWKQTLTDALLDQIRSSFTQPTNLRFSEQTSTSIRIMWDASTGNVTGYYILRKENQPVDAVLLNDQYYDSFQWVNNDNLIIYKNDETTYVDRELNPAITYYYKVIAYN